MIKEIYAILDRAEDLKNLSDAELIRLKWAAEGLALKCKEERQGRDARAVDDICNLDAHEREEDAADYRRRQVRDDAAIDALEGKKSK